MVDFKSDFLGAFPGAWDFAKNSRVAGQIIANPRDDLDVDPGQLRKIANRQRHLCPRWSDQIVEHERRGLLSGAEFLHFAGEVITYDLPDATGRHESVGTRTRHERPYHQFP